MKPLRVFDVRVRRAIPIARWVINASLLLHFALGCSTSPADTLSTGPDGSGSRGSSGTGAPGGSAHDSSASGSGSGFTSGSGDGASSGTGASSGSATPGDDSGVLGPTTGDASSSLSDAGVGLGSDAGVGWDTVPVIVSRIVPPVFNNLDCDITKYNGVGDGTTDNTAAFAAAIAACVAGGGGRVVVPMGVFFTGPIELKSNINLYVSAGATIRFTADPTKYLPVVKVSWEGSLIMNYRPLIWAHDATNVAITGTGTIDGHATSADWYAWKATEGPDQANSRMQNAMGVPPEQRIYGAGHFLRPGLIELMNCTNVLFDGFTAQNSPFWTIHPVLCTNVTARNFRSLGSVANTDGFDPESCTDVLVQNATIQVGDDALAIKAGRDRDGWTLYKPSQNIVIQNSNLLSRHGGLAIGSEMSGGVRNVYFENSTLGNLSNGFNIKSAVTRGGYIRDIYARKITAMTIAQFFQLTGHYVSGAVIGLTMFTDVSNINLDGITVGQSGSSPFIISGADATKPAVGIHFNNVTVASALSPALAAGSGHYVDLTTTGVVVNGAAFNPPSSAP